MISFTAAIQLNYTDSGMTVISPYDINYMTMQGQQTGSMSRDSLQMFPQGRLYTIGETQMVF